jgi:hypothetical protein
LHRIFETRNTFDDGGWLRIGLAGHQPELGDGYISTGSLYLTSAAFLPLGLLPEDGFWSGPDEPWTSQLIWGGENVKRPAGPGGTDSRIFGGAGGHEKTARFCSPLECTSEAYEGRQRKMEGSGGQEQNG